MKTINPEHPEVAALHAAIMQEFGCCLCPILGPGYSEAKLVAVFVLRHFLGYSRRAIAVAYALPVYWVDNIMTGGKRRMAKLRRSARNCNVF